MNLLFSIFVCKKVGQWYELLKSHPIFVGGSANRYELGSLGYNDKT